MNLSLKNKEVLKKYKNNTQIIRVLSENWFEKEMFCPCCLNNKITKYPNNKKVSDFFCDSCKNEFQLKSSKKKFSNKVVDGEYFTMINSINNLHIPNFFLLTYNSTEWYVKDLFLIPKFFINTQIIEKRKPLSQEAKRYGWTGCNILLNKLPLEAKINIIKNEKVFNINLINKSWKKMFFLNLKKPNLRGWTSDILKCINDIKDREFTLKEIYKFKDYLKELHPNNFNIEAKIRQQLQVLRDNKLIEFKSNGKYKKI